MKVNTGTAVVTLLLAGSIAAFAQSPLVLGTAGKASRVSFICSTQDGWGLEIDTPAAPPLLEPKPARLEVDPGKGPPTEIAAGYRSVQLVGGAARADADVKDGAVTFRISDTWTIQDGNLAVYRSVKVVGNAEGGFSSAVMLATSPGNQWGGIKFFAPGVIYGDPSHDGARAPGGPINDALKRFDFREDILQAPLLAMWFQNGDSISVLDPTPQGDTTTEETRAGTDTTLVSESFRFGALGARENLGQGVQFGFWMPGTVREVPRPFTGISQAGELPQSDRGAATVSWRRRYNPIREGFSQSYNVQFRFGADEDFLALERNSWRWAWSVLKPAVDYRDLGLVQRTLIDFLETRVVSIDGRTGIPYLLDSRTGEYMTRADARRAAMGFCAKNIEAADQLLQEADRDPSPRGQKMRASGEAIIATFIRLIPMSPPAGDGFNLFTGKIETAVWSVNQQFLRTIAEAQLTLLHAYQREKALGRDHPEWLRWSKSFTDWLLTQQRADGSFPRAWYLDNGVVYNPSGSATYMGPPLLTAFAQQTGDRKYLDAAIRAGEYLWQHNGREGHYEGGAVDASSPELTTDKESGMLSLEAFLSLYNATQDPKWLKRAQAAANYTETWILIWNIPMPVDANNEKIHWKKGIPTVGLQAITTKGAGGQDEYLDWGTPLFAELYNDTKDPHDLDVARVLLQDTKEMLALPGQTFGMLGPGWQQEHWLMSANRGYGQPGKWLPWLATGHLHSIMALQTYDPALYRKLAVNPIVGGGSPTKASGNKRH